MMTTHFSVRASSDQAPERARALRRVAVDREKARQGRRITQRGSVRVWSIRQGVQRLHGDGIVSDAVFDRY